MIFLGPSQSLNFWSCFIRQVHLWPPRTHLPAKAMPCGWPGLHTRVSPSQIPANWGLAFGNQTWVAGQSRTSHGGLVLETHRTKWWDCPAMWLIKEGKAVTNGRFTRIPPASLAKIAPLTLEDGQNKPPLLLWTGKGHQQRLTSADQKKQSWQLLSIIAHDLCRL